MDLATRWCIAGLALASSLNGITGMLNGMSIRSHSDQLAQVNQKVYILETKDSCNRGSERRDEEC